MSEAQFGRNTGNRALDEDIARLYKRVATLEAAAARMETLVAQAAPPGSSAGRVEGDTVETIADGLPIPASVLILDEGFTLSETGLGALIGVDVEPQIEAATEETVTTLEDLGLAFRRLLVNLAGIIGEEFLDDVLTPHFERGIGEQ